MEYLHRGVFVSEKKGSCKTAKHNTTRSFSLRDMHGKIRSSCKKMTHPNDSMFFCVNYFVFFSLLSLKFRSVSQAVKSDNKGCISKWQAKPSTHPRMLKQKSAITSDPLLGAVLVVHHWDSQFGCPHKNTNKMQDKLLPCGNG